MTFHTDELVQTVAAYEANDRNQRATALQLGLARSTLQNRLRRAAEQGLMGFSPVLPGFRVSKTTEVLDGDGNISRQFIQQRPGLGDEFEVPAGFAVKGESALIDASGRVIQKWVKTREERDPVDLVETLKAAFVGYEPSAPISTPPAYIDEDLLTLIPCNDWHVGMFAWKRETGADWDLEIAEREIGRGIEDAIARSPRAGTAIVLGGGDLTHADNNNNETERSRNKLDVDGRHQKVMEVAGRLMARTVDAALRHNGRVLVRNLKGNHDKETAPAIAWYLSAWYRNEPRATIDLDQSKFFYHQHGLTMLAATHGDEAKLKDMPQVMAARQPVMWGATLYRYAHGFHVHHKSGFVTEGGGVVCESHQAPIVPDGWHFGAGFSSGRSLQTIAYHRKYGETGRVRVVMPSAANDNNEQERKAA